MTQHIKIARNFSQKKENQTTVQGSDLREK